MATDKTFLSLNPFSTIGLCPTTSLPDDYPVVGYNTLMPDWPSIRLMTNGHASVVCSTFGPTSPSQKYRPEICPRTVLQNVLELSTTQHGLSFRVGFELEFYLLAETANNTGHLNEYQSQQAIAPTLNRASAVRSTLPLSQCVEECTTALGLSGICVLHYHAESSAHMFEIATSPLPPLQAIDTLYQSQEIIHCIAAKHKLRACFLPRPFLDLDSVGLHAHLSINPASSQQKSLGFSENTLDSFLAGVLSRLPQICALAMPSDESYKRQQDGQQGAWVAWGTRNRSTPVRRVSPDHFEFRAIDCTANLYLKIASYCTAGILGVKEKAALRWKDCASKLSTLGESTRESLGITVRMPNTAEEAFNILRNEPKGLSGILGKDFLNLYHIIKTGEPERLRKLSEEQQRVLYSLEY